MSESNVPTDQMLLEGLKNNDGKAIRILYKSFFNVVLKFVISNSGTEQEAKDIYQDSILVLYQNVFRDDFQLNCQLQTYLFSIAKRLWLKQIGKNSRFQSLEKITGADAEVDVSNSLQYSENKELNFLRMEEGLNRLGEPCRTLITDFYYNKLNMEDIAVKFGYTNADNAKNQKYKCLQRLKKMFNQEE